MHPLRPAVAQFLLQGTAPEIQPELVDESAKLVRSGGPDHHRRRVGHITETLFTLAQLFLRLLPLRYVFDRSDVTSEFSLVRIYRASQSTNPADLSLAN